jgi:hypothetical protein
VGGGTVEAEGRRKQIFFGSFFKKELLSCSV